ncbi:MAG: acetyl-CoA carboxylase carboxyltransferase subunit alpha [Oscillospiraceae bacterium]
MSVKLIEESLNAIEERINAFKKDENLETKETVKQLLEDKLNLEKEASNNISVADRVFLARHPKRLSTMDCINELFDNFIPLSGDRNYKDDESIIGGLAFFDNIAVTVIGHRKGRRLEENIRFNFGMPNPEGYRKAERLMLQAEKFNRPIITFIDTPGAYPGLEAEARGQGEAIASCLYTMSRLTVPIISIVLGEGGSGGALAIAIADRLIMLENSIFSVLSPEGFASILWKDASKWREAAEVMKLTSYDLKKLKIADEIIKEPPCGVHRNPNYVISNIRLSLENNLKVLLTEKGKNLQEKRYEKLKAIGKIQEGI